MSGCWRAILAASPPIAPVPADGLTFRDGRARERLDAVPVERFGGRLSKTIKELASGLGLTFEVLSSGSRVGDLYKAPWVPLAGEDDGRKCWGVSSPQLARSEWDR